jgi:hypothetical protein
LCFVVSLIRNNKDHIIDTRLLQLGLFFTTFADLALVILENYILGVIIFTIVQLIYIGRYTRDKFNIVLRKLLIVFAIIFSSYFIISKVIIKTSFILIPIGLFYAVCLITSVVKAIAISQDSSYLNRNKHMIAVAMVLFLLCDASIAISYVLRALNIVKVSYLFSNLIWIFYLPSQVLLSLSGYGKSN